MTVLWKVTGSDSGWAAVSRFFNEEGSVVFLGVEAVWSFCNIFGEFADVTGVGIITGVVVRWGC